MKVKKKHTVFIASLAENAVKVLACEQAFSPQAIFTGAVAVPLDNGASDVARRLGEALKQMGRRDELVIFSLPRSQATCRVIKIPSVNPLEIEQIVSLQAPRYLPYAAEELICAHQVVSVDEAGNSNVNITIAHRDTIERYLAICNELSITKFSIVLHPYGVASAYAAMVPAEVASVMVLDVGTGQTELAILSDAKVFFSRAFKVEKERPDFADVLFDEIKKSQETFQKESGSARPQKLVIMGAGELARHYAGALKPLVSFPVDVLACEGRIACAQDTAQYIEKSEYSFAGLFGFGQRMSEPALNLLPPATKQHMVRLARRKEMTVRALLCAGIVIAAVAGLLKNIDNKAGYVTRMQKELDAITKEARPLEDMEKRFKVLESLVFSKPSSLDVLHELFKVAPAGIQVSNFAYDEGKQVVIRGSSPGLSPVLELTSSIDKSSVFDPFDVKMRYATQKRSQKSEMVEFEIICTKK